MMNRGYIKSLIKEVVVDLLSEEEVEDVQAVEFETPEDVEKAKFEEDPINYILQKYPSLTDTLAMLMTKHFKDYVTGIYIVAPKPTTFKIVLHNGQFFILTFLGKAYNCRVAGKSYYLLTISEKESAILSIARLLETGSPITTKGPDKEEVSAPQDAPEEKPAETAEEEETES
jgi:hypothetical protein